MRALAVTNPNATAMSPRTRDVIVRALGSELKIDVAETTRRGHAAELAAEARADGFDLVVAVGGDGTVNEIVSGLLAGGVGPDVPRLAVVPSGSANVFARALGLPGEPIEATGAVLERLRGRRERRIGLGRLETTEFSRWFTFSAGFGLDAEIVREVERRRTAGARATPALYLRTGLRQFAVTNRRHPGLTIETPHATTAGTAAAGTSRAGASPAAVSAVEHVFMAIVTNTTPWTYYGSRPLEPTPEASFEAGLDAFALHRLSTFGTAQKLRRLFAGKPTGNQHVTRLHDQSQLTVRSSHPTAVEVDGDYLGEFEVIRLQSVPEAVAVIA